LKPNLGYRLFVRKTRELLLTPAGERLAPQHPAGPERGGTGRSTTSGARPHRRVWCHHLSVVRVGCGWCRGWRPSSAPHPGVEIRIDAQGRRVDLEAEGIDHRARRCRRQDAPPGAVALLVEDVTPGTERRAAEPVRRAAAVARRTCLKLPLIEIEDDIPGDMLSSWMRWFEFAGVQAGSEANSPVMVVAYIDQSMSAAPAGRAWCWRTGRFARKWSPAAC